MLQAMKLTFRAKISRLGEPSRLTVRDIIVVVTKVVHWLLACRKYDTQRDKYRQLDLHATASAARYHTADPKPNYWSFLMAHPVP